MARARPTEIESLDDLLAAEPLPLESGTRRAARAEPEEGAEERRDSQRPTFRVPATQGLARYLDAPPRIDTADLPRSEESLAEMLAMLEQNPVIDDAPPSPRVAEPAGGPRPSRSTLLPPALNPEPVAVVTMPALSSNTLRVRLTPYAREHAVADAGADDTPAEMLRYLKLLGSFDRLPYLIASMHDVMIAKLDHREGFVLSLVDGASNIDTILDACPMPTHKTLRILYGLYERGILGLR